MLKQFYQASSQTGLQMNLSKTKVMISDDIRVVIGNQISENVSGL